MHECFLPMQKSLGQSTGRTSGCRTDVAVARSAGFQLAAELAPGEAPPMMRVSMLSSTADCSTVTSSSTSMSDSASLSCVQGLGLLQRRLLRKGSNDIDHKIQLVFHGGRQVHGCRERPGPG